MKKYAALSTMNKDFLQRILKFRPISIGAPMMIKTCRFKFFYTFGLVPSLGFEAVNDASSFYYIGDTLLNL